MTLPLLLAVPVLRPLQDVPFIDDWTYAWSVEHLLTRGELRFLDWTLPINPVQTLWGALFAWPLGFSFAALRLSTLLLACAGLAAFYLTLREVGVARGPGIMGAWLLAVHPLYFLLSFSFMTDVPFLSLTLMATLAYVRAVKRGGWGWWLTGAALATAAGLVRQLGVALPAGVLAFALIARRPQGPRPAPLLSAFLPMAIILAFNGYALSRLVVSSGVEFGDTLNQRIALLPTNALYAVKLLPMAVTVVAQVIGLGLAPLALALAPTVRPRRWLAGLAALGAATAAASWLGNWWFLPPDTMWNLAELGESRDLVPGAVPRSVPPYALPALAVVTFLSAPVLALPWIEHLRQGGWSRPEGLVALAGLAYAGGVAFLFLYHDRYILPLFPTVILAGLMALRHTWRGFARLALAPGMALFLFIGWTGERDQLSYSAALWDGVAWLEGWGVPAAHIDGGYMVNGWLLYAHPQRAWRDPQGRIDVPWVTSTSWRPFRIANSEEADWYTVKRIPYRWRGATHHLYVQKYASGTPAPAAPARASP